MKTRKAMKEYKCHQCGSVINKGEQYAKKSIRMGQMGTPCSDGTVRTWEPYRITVPLCNKCANP